MKPETNSHHDELPRSEQRSEKKLPRLVLSWIIDHTIFAGPPRIPFDVILDLKMAGRPYLKLLKGEVKDAEEETRIKENYLRAYRKFYDFAKRD